LTAVATVARRSARTRRARVAKAVAAKKTGIRFGCSTVTEEDFQAGGRGLLDTRNDLGYAAMICRAFCVDGLKQIVRLHHRVIDTLLLSR
jgi:hypothetical protein